MRGEKEGVPSLVAAETARQATAPDGALARRGGAGSEGDPDHYTAHGLAQLEIGPRTVRMVVVAADAGR